MDCTLKIIVGPEAGLEFICSGPETYLGRSQRCAVRLGSPSISFEHALITRTGDDFFVENLSANGTILNNERLLSKTRLRAKDQIRMGGDTVARVESLPAAATAGSSRRLLLAAVVGLLILALVVVIVDPFSVSDSKNWLGVYRMMQQYALEQVARNGMPQDVPALLSEAWRLESAGDRNAAGKAWMKLHVKLDAWDQIQGRVETSQSTRGLERLKSGTVMTLPDDDMRTALKQFVIMMERRK
jgi:pSer/pThr/pTyr-binding forkhead associated (FHA) protein